MAASETAMGSEAGNRALEPPLPEDVDWVVAVVVALGGLALSVGGTILLFVLDPNLLKDGIESGQITIGLVERDLTEAEMLDFVVKFVDWTGIGLLLTGLALVVFAAGYVVARNRANRRTGDSTGSALQYAVIGATTSAVLSFVPFSPILGGGLAGYLGRQDTGHSTSVGAYSGFLYVLPALVVILFLTVGIFSGLSAVQEGGLGAVVVALMLIVLLFVAAYGAGVGALGGFIGGRLVDD